MPKFLSGASSTSVRRPLRQYSQMVRSSSGDMRAAAARTSLSKPIVVTILAWGQRLPWSRSSNPCELYVFATKDLGVVNRQHLSPLGVPSPGAAGLGEGHRMQAAGNDKPIPFNRVGDGGCIGLDHTQVAKGLHRCGWPPVAS